LESVPLLNRSGHGDPEKGDWAVGTDHGRDNTASRALMQSAEHAYRFKVGSTCGGKVACSVIRTQYGVRPRVGIAAMRNVRFIEISGATVTGWSWPILLKNAKTRSLHFLAKLNRDRQFAV
jgi:hypothetical protein